MQMEEQYNGYLGSEKVAEESLRVTKIKYEVGMATQADVIDAEMSLAQAREDLIDLTCEHEIQVMYFCKPWTYGQ